VTVTDVAALTLPAVTGKVCEEAPEGTVTDVGTPAALLELESVTTIPPVPAAVVRVTVPTPDWPLVITPGLTETPLSAAGIGFTVRVAVLLRPAKEAVKVAGVDPLTAPVVIGKLCEVAPDGTVTVPGTPAAVLELDSVTIAPPLPAAEVRVTVPVPDWPLVMVLGVAVMLLKAGATGVTVTPKVAFTPE
jgi:hypothetical protein